MSAILKKTAAALEAYDVAGVAMDSVDAASIEACEAVVTAYDTARLEVAKAFADETADRNDPVTVVEFVVRANAGLDFVRHMVAADKAGVL